ncbi:MAG: hypothetical protein FJ386_10855 [Verrucomicrobia bacterium]|nr:hypothetical protein [Verrucomicrobiota bacterium]
MNPAATRAQLSALMRDMTSHWGEIRAEWRDARGEEFELRYVQPLQTHMTSALTALEKLEGIMAKVRRDCE